MKTVFIILIMLVVLCVKHILIYKGTYNFFLRIMMCFFSLQSCVF